MSPRPGSSGRRARFTQPSLHLLAEYCISFIHSDVRMIIRVLFNTQCKTLQLERRRDWEGERGGLNVDSIHNMDTSGAASLRNGMNTPHHSLGCFLSHSGSMFFSTAFLHSQNVQCQPVGQTQQLRDPRGNKCTNNGPKCHLPLSDSGKDAGVPSKLSEDHRSKNSFGGTRAELF